MNSSLIVVKIGGGDGMNYEAIAQDAAQFWQKGTPLILVHGGNAELNRVAEQIGHPSQFLKHPNGMTSRLTDRRALEIFEMVYCGLVNKRLVERLQAAGANALGLSGLDGQLLRGRRKTAVKYVENDKIKIHRGDYTGSVESVNETLLKTLIASGFLPVLTPPALSRENEAINVDGDQIAALIARTMQASVLVLLSNVPGLLARFPDESSLIRHIPASRVEQTLEIAQERMKKKALSAAEAIQAGVKKVIFADGRVNNPLQRALAGEGTVIE